MTAAPSFADIQRAQAAIAGMMARIPAKSATLELVVEARDNEHAQAIRDQLAAKGFRQI